MITHDQLVSALRAALEPLDYVNAMWLSGSQAFGRSDDLSDVDAVLDVADGRQRDAFAVAEHALAALSPIAIRFELPEPTWHGHSQRFYRLEGCPEHLMIDLCIMQRGSKASRFDEREIHGEPVVVFDKLGIVRSVPVDRDAHRARMRVELDKQRTRFYLLRHLAGKEVMRGNEIDALWRYHQFVLVPLIAVLRTRHAPMHHDFSPRYLKRHLPAEVYARLMRLSYASDLADLEHKLAEAITWAEEEFASIDIDSIPL